MTRSITPILIILLISACTQNQRLSEELPSQARAYEVHRQQLESLTSWSLSGKLAISDGKDGGTGNLEWTQQKLASQISFRGTFGKGSWRLHVNESGARLELADGSTHLAESVEELVQIQLGWNIPVEALSWWVKGLAHPTPWDQRVLDEDGRLQNLYQQGWAVEFAEYNDGTGVWLPKKLTARKDGFRVKLVVREWQMPMGSNF